MLNVVQELKLNSSITSISFTKKYVLVVDSYYSLYVINLETFKLKQSIKLANFEDDTLHPYTKAISSSSDGYLALPDENLITELTFLFDENEEVQNLKELSWHLADIEVSKFSHNSKYLTTGSQNGKVFIFEVPAMELLTSLPNRPDFIASLSYSSDSRRIASSSFDKTTIVFDLKRMVMTNLIKTKDVVETTAFFDKNQKIFLATNGGTSIIYDCVERSILSSFNHFNSWPSTVEISKDEKFAVVATRHSYVYIIRLEDNAKVLEVNLGGSGISLVKIYKNYVLLGFIDGKLQILEFDKYLKELENYIKNKKYREAKDILKKNIFLRIHPCYEEFDNVWPEILEKAVELITADKIKEALELVEPFVEDDEKKNEEFNIFLMKKEIMREFMQIIHKEDYRKAYLISEDNQYLKSTNAYKELERKWARTFNKAKKYLEEDPKLNINIAKKILTPFQNIDSKKNLISNLLKNANMFKVSEELIKKRQIKAYFSVVKKYPVLKETEVYKKVISLGDSLFKELIEHENKENFTEAKKVGTTLLGFLSHAITTKEKLKSIEEKENLILMIKNKKFQDACELVHKNPMLSSLRIFKKLEERFESVFEEAKEDAFQGNAQGVIAEIGSYYKIGYWQKRVTATIKIAYINQLKQVRVTQAISWVDTLANYIKRFGIDAEIETIAREYQVYEDLEVIAKQADEHGYKKHPFIESLIVE